MAFSLQSSCMVLATNSRRHRLPQSPNTRPFRVSCSAGHGGRVDRRNMLLGLGGLYGAANLISDPKASSAGPIEAPTLKNCSTVREFGSNNLLDAMCCPPVSEVPYIDYVLPPVDKEKMRVRRPAHVIQEDKEFLAKYESGIRQMKALDKTDPSDPRGFMQQANIHCAYCNGAYSQDGEFGAYISVHYSWLFFPFHRWYIYFYERIIGELIGDPTFALPFWNWDNGPGMYLPGIYDNPNSSLYDENRNQSNRPPTVVDLALKSDPTSDEQRKNNNLSIMYNEMIGCPASAEEFMGYPYRKGEKPPPRTFGGTIERGCHTGIHVWTGNPNNKYLEDLGNFYSAGRDPAFYAHHSNVDRLWTIWDTLGPDVPRKIEDEDFLNASFLFYDEKKKLVRVTVRQCLDYTQMGYEFATVETPWRQFKPAIKQAAGVPIQEIGEATEDVNKVKFPLTLDDIIRVLVPRSETPQDDEKLVLENVEITAATRVTKFDVYVNLGKDEAAEVDKANYAGTYSHLPHQHPHGSAVGPFSINLKNLYKNIGISDDDDKVVVTIVPKCSTGGVKIAGIKIEPAV